MNQKLKVFTDYLYENEIRWADMVYLRQPIADVWHEYTWSETMLRARKITSFLKSLGLQKGDKIAILSKNCAEWFIADFAIIMGGFVSVPLYVAQLPSTINYILNHAEVKAIFVGKLDNWENLEPSIPHGVIKIDFPYENPMPAEYHWNNILEKFPPDADDLTPAPDDLYTILYTSGTTGDPKGVMITFDAVSHFLEHAKKESILQRIDHQYYMSYLPLAHILERLVLEGSSLIKETTISFAETVAKFPQNLQDVSPTIFIAPPRIWDQFQKGVLARTPQNVLNLLLKIPLMSGWIKKRITRKLGLGRAYWCISGSARMSLSTLEWFRKLDITICEGYGLTENLAYGTMQLPEEVVEGSAGKAQAGVEMKLADNGELLTRSDVMMAGYYKDPEATKNAFTEDGFFHTGDLATIDENGYITIIGRIHDPFKTDKGEFVNPIRLEEKFAENPFIDQLCVIGLTLPQPVLLVTISQPVKKLQTEAQLTRSLHRTLERVNSQLASFEKVSRIIVCKETWSTENKLMTPTFKVKRNEIQHKYIDLAKKVSDRNEIVYWE